MLKLDTRIDLDAGKFFHWWGEELSFLIPVRLLRILGRFRDRLVLTRLENRLTALYFGETGSRLAGEWPLDASIGDKRRQLFADNPEFEEADLILRLGPGQALVRTFKLPGLAEENLHQVVSYEMDRLTPFKADQVYFDVKVLERLPDARQIRVELALTPRRKLDVLLDELAAMGWFPESVDVAGGTEGVSHDLLPDKYRRPRKSLPNVLTAVSSVLAIALILALLGLPLVMKYKLLDGLQKEVKATAKIAQEVQTLREETEKLANESGFLLEKKRKEPVVVDMLDELTKVIPDQTSLNGLQYRDHKVTIQGESPAASSLIEQIEASPYFKNTSFVSPVTKDVASGKERFQIASEVVNGRFFEHEAD